jgi:hypothetical protein
MKDEAASEVFALLESLRIVLSTASMHLLFKVIIGHKQDHLTTTHDTLYDMLKGQLNILQ